MLSVVKGLENIFYHEDLEGHEERHIQFGNQELRKGAGNAIPDFMSSRFDNFEERLFRRNKRKNTQRGFVAPLTVPLSPLVPRGARGAGAKVGRMAGTRRRS